MNVEQLIINAYEDKKKIFSIVWTKRARKEYYVRSGYLADDSWTGNQLRLPYGSEGEGLYRQLPDYIAKNKCKLEKEIALMARWVASDHNRFNTWKILTNLTTECESAENTIW